MIFLTVLKIMGLVLLFITALFFALVFVALFSGLRYDISAEYSENLRLRAKARWIFGLARFRYDAEKGPPSLKILFFEMLDRNKGIEEKEKRERKEKNKEIAEEEIPGPDPKKTQELIGEPADKEKKRGLISRAKSALGLIKSALDHPDRAEITAHTKKLVKRLVRALGLKIFRMYALVGFDDPATTGEAIALICLLRSATGLDLRADGDFEKRAFSLDARVRGKTTVWRLFLPLLIYILKRPIWNLIRPPREKTGPTNKHKKRM